jgi:hypothetical protein
MCDARRYEAQEAKKKALSYGKKQGRAVCPDETGETLEVGYVLKLDGIDTSSSTVERYAEEDHFHESGEFFADE